MAPLPRHLEALLSPCHAHLTHPPCFSMHVYLLACTNTQLAFLTLSDFFSIGTSATADGGPAPPKAFSSIQRGLRVASVSPLEKELKALIFQRGIMQTAFRTPIRPYRKSRVAWHRLSPRLNDASRAPSKNRQAFDLDERKKDQKLKSFLWRR